MSQKFYYFGFGSNMLAQRIRIQNPSAVRVGPGKLLNYRLDFHTGSKNWLGAPATIVPTPGAHVYGAIWEIDSCHMKDLDNQESVHEGVYVPLTVPVVKMTSAGAPDSLTESEILECRAYHLTHQPANDLRTLPHDRVPLDRQPSKTYLKTLIKGAIETGIDGAYVEWLRSLKHNGQTVEKFEEHLQLQDINI